MNRIWEIDCIQNEAKVDFKNIDVRCLRMLHDALRNADQTRNERLLMKTERYVHNIKLAHFSGR